MVEAAGDTAAECLSIAERLHLKRVKLVSCALRLVARARDVANQLLRLVVCISQLIECKLFAVLRLPDLAFAIGDDLVLRPYDRILLGNDFLEPLDGCIAVGDFVILTQS